MSYAIVIQALKGGGGSGNFGHSGRPGKLGGSAPNSARSVQLFQQRDVRINPNFQAGLTGIYANPNSYKDLMGFLTKQQGNRDDFVATVFYADPRTGGFVFSGGDDHLIMAKSIVHGDTKSTQERRAASTKLDDAMVHGYLKYRDGKLKVSFRTSGVGLAKLETRYTDRDKETASKRIYAAMDALKNMGFPEFNYQIQSPDGWIENTY